MKVMFLCNRAALRSHDQRRLVLDSGGGRAKNALMPHDLDSPARLTFGADPLHEPQDWSNAEQFGTLRQALEAAAGRMGEHPWIRAGEQVIAPPDVDDLWKEAFRPLSD